MGRTYSTNGEGDKFMQHFNRETSQEETVWETKEKMEDSIKWILSEYSLRLIGVD
jgi:hypothetical protein